MIKKYVDDHNLSWEERYRRLEAHHVEETKALLAAAQALRTAIGVATDHVCRMLLMFFRHEVKAEGEHKFDIKFTSEVQERLAKAMEDTKWLEKLQ